MKRIVLLAVAARFASSGVLHADPRKKSVDANLTRKRKSGPGRSR